MPAGLLATLIDRHTFKSRDQARLELFRDLQGFATRRGDSALDYQSSERFERKERKRERVAEAVGLWLSESQLSTQTRYLQL